MAVNVLQISPPRCKAGHALFPCPATQGLDDTHGERRVLNSCQYVSDKLECKQIDLSI